MIRLIAPILVTVLFAACSSSKVLKTEKAEGVDFSSFKTFDFYKVVAGGDTNSQNYHENIGKLEDAVAITLQKYGYLLSKTNPDLLVNIGVVVKEEIQTRQTDLRTDAPKYVGQRRYTWKSQEVEVARYRQGTVTIDLVDRKQNRLVWQAAIEDIIPEKQASLEKTIRKGVKKLFASYPVAK